MNKLILNFNSKDTKKIKNVKNFLGGKGANLSEMGRMGLPVPPGFTISTKVCDLFYKDKKKLNSKIVNTIKKELKVIEKEVKKKFGDLKNPLLLSVRSGARVSMPGMMDTILNLGLNDKTVIASIEAKLKEPGSKMFTQRMLEEHVMREFKQLNIWKARTIVRDVLRKNGRIVL